MKRSISVLFVMIMFFQAAMADWNGINSTTATPASKTLISSNIDNSTIRFKVDGYFSTEVQTPLGPAQVISLDQATPMLEAGAPDLPKLTASVIIPNRAEMKVEVISSSYRDIENIFIAPSKGNLTRDIDPSSVPYIFGQAYQENSFYPGTLAGMREPHIVRDFRGQTVIVYPFQYNPLTHTLRVYYDITVRVSKLSENGINQLDREGLPEKVDAHFNGIYNRHFLNSTSASRYTPVEEYGNMLIISYGAFMDAMQPYILWKKQVGYPIEMVDVASIGNSTAIKTFIANYYNSKGLTFVLLVGDAPQQVPSSSTSAGDSDNNYAYIVGGDHYPDLFIGRFSAETVEQVETQVERTIEYEQSPLMGTDWYTFCTGIASDQGPGDDGEMDFQHIRNIQDDLMAFTYTYENELFDGSQGGNDASGNPTPAQVAEDVNAGTSIINYTGHGSDNSWGSSGFSSTDVNNLVNDNMLPFVWSVACVNGNFVSGNCFAEAWLRATHNGEPTGAVAFFGSTINQSWNPPMAGQDEMNDILVETYPTNINRTFGALSIHGCMLMNDEYGSGGDEMTDTWTIFGDPSLMVRTAVPQEMTVTHDQVLFIGFDEMTIAGGVDGARATLSDNGVILSTGVIQGGTLTLSFATLTAPATLTLTITAFNYLPYITSIDVIPAEGAFLVLGSVDVNDPEGNNNGLIDYNESVNLTIELENVGIEDATEVIVTLTSQDPYVTITDGSELYPLVPAGGTLAIADAFSFDVSSGVPDQHKISFTLNSSNGDGSWQNTFLMNANAPLLHINSLIIDDSNYGNGDGELDPGEQVTMTVDYTNSGHAIAYNVDVFMEGQSAFIDITNPSQHFNSIGFLGVFQKSWDVMIDDQTPEGIAVNFMNELTMGDFFMDKNYLSKISALVEDFETGDLNKFEWQSAGNLPWQVISQYPMQGFFSAQSGAITHNQSSELVLNFNVMLSDSISFYRKVSSETADKLKFYIGDELIGEWSGTGAGWRRETFPVSAGITTFKWVYQKNGSLSAGTDCAWIDMIMLPSPMVTTSWAGPDDGVCTGNDYLIGQSYATCFTSVEWSTTGSGSFNDNTAVNPVYTPSQGDKDNGEVGLIMTVWGEEGAIIVDDLLLAVKDVPAAPATPAGPDYVDVTVTTSSQYTTEGIEGVAQYNWFLAPADAGTISGNGLTATVTWSSAYMGTAYVSVAGVNECGEGAASEAFVITVDNMVGMPDRSETATYRIYPNPTSNHLYIASNGTAQTLDIRIYDLMGAVVYRKDRVSLDASGTITIDVETLPEGLYILSLVGQTNRKDLKLVIR